MKSFVLFGLLFCVCCKDTGPHPSDLVGKYNVSIKLKEDVINKDKIKESVDDAVKDAQAELSKAKEELSKEMDFSHIDTTTMEGKIEYAAKKFGSSMAEIGIGLGEKSNEMGSLFSDLAGQGVGLGASLLNNIKIILELQADGDIKAKGSLISLGLSDATWEVKGDDFLLKTRETDTPDVFHIIERSSKGFTLEKDKWVIEFVKVQE